MAKREKAADDHVAAPFGGAGGTVTVNGKAYAAGLIWETSSEGKPDAVARSQAAERSADLFCVRVPGRVQYGLGSTTVGHKAGMAPVAAFLSETLTGNFVGAFDVPEGVYIVAVREDTVLAGVDRVVADREEAIEAFHELYLAQTWNEAYCPKEWEIPGPKPTDIDTLLSGAKPKATLRTVSKRGTYLKLAGLATVAIVGFLSYTAYQSYLEDQVNEQQEQARIVRQKAEADERQKLAQQRLPPFPWENQAPAVLVFAACQDAILAADTTVPGWDPLSINCYPGRTGKGMLTLEVSYKRSGGTINWFAPFLNKDGFKPTLVLDKQGNAVVSWTMQGPAPSYTDASKTSPITSAQSYLTQQFEEVFVQSELKPANGPDVEILSPGTMGRAEKKKVVLERHLAFSIKTRHDPKDFAAILAPIPVATATMVRLDIAGWVWTLEGNVYEKLDPQPGTPAPRR